MQQQVWRDLFNRAGLRPKRRDLFNRGAPSAAFQFKAYSQDDAH
jgi:hypothetical protein